MKTKEQIVKEIEGLIFENNLPQNESLEIVAYGDENVKVDFVEIGFGGLQKRLYCLGAVRRGFRCRRIC